MKYSIVVIAIVLLVSGVFIFVFDQETENKNVSFGKKIEGAKEDVFSKKIVKNKKKPKAQKANEMPIENNDELELAENLAVSAINETKECENQIQDLFGVDDEEEKLNNMDESSLVIFLDSFDQIEFSSKSLGKLMNHFAINQNLVREIEESANEESVFDNLHPCSPFKKMNIVNLLSKRMSVKDIDPYLKDRLRKSINLFFRKELQYDVGLSQLNLVLNLMLSMSKDDQIFNKNDVEKLLNSLEDDYDKIVDRAESLSEDGDESAPFENLLDQELRLSKKYNLRIKQIINSSL